MASARSSQAAAIAALDGPQDLLAERAAIYRERRDLVVDWLNQAPGVSRHKPEGAFYVFPNIAGCIGKTTARRPPSRQRCRFRLGSCRRSSMSPPCPARPTA